MTAAQGDLGKALELYAWNAILSGAMAATMAHVEVVLRNAIHENLTGWSAERFSICAGTGSPIRSSTGPSMTFVALADWVCPVSRMSIEGHCEVAAVLDERP